MTDYTELVKALRFETDYVDVEKTMRYAAAAIESLQKELDAANHQLKMYSMCPFDDEEEEE